jgi:hypothetical protein
MGTTTLHPTIRRGLASAAGDPKHLPEARPRSLVLTVYPDRALSEFGRRKTSTTDRSVPSHILSLLVFSKSATTVFVCLYSRW